VVGRDGDEVRTGGDAQILFDEHVVAEAGAHRPGNGRGDREVELRTAAVAAVDAEDLADNAELERGNAGEGDQDDLLEHASSAWHELYGTCRSSQSRPSVVKHRVPAKPAPDNLDA